MPPTGPLRAEAYPDATVVPFTRFTRQSGRPALRMGVFDARSRIVPASLLRRSFGKVGFAADLTPATQAAAREDAREVVFGGRLSRHFGHFLLESLAKAWYAGQHPELPIAWACPADRTDAGYTPWQASVLEVLGLTNEPVFVDHPTRFASVVVPDSGYRIKDFLAPQHAAFLAAFPARPREPERRVWLSRSRVDRGVLHAPRLEAELAAAGWSVVHPETLSLGDQLELLASAGRVAGDEGSAFHLLALLADVAGLRVDIFCRHPDRTVEEQNGNYLTIAEARSIDQHMHVLPEEVLIASKSTKVVKLATTLAGYRQILGLPVPRPGHVTGGPGIVHELAQRSGAGSYLELTAGEPIGLDLPLPARVIVSEAFGFDPRGRAEHGLELYEMPPPDYFEYLAGERSFELVVVAGDLQAEVSTWLERARPHAPDASWLIAAEPDQVPSSLGTARRVVEHERVWTLIERAS